MDFISTLFLLGQRILYIAIAFFGIGFLIGFHELGHFLFCKLFKIKTPSFSIGFGPKIFSKKIGGTEFSLSAIPLGGFVEIAGAAEVGQGEQKDAHSKASDSFAVKPYYQKFLVMMGGILNNLIFAYFTFILLMLVGIPKTPLLYPNNTKKVIQHVEPNSAAALAGIQPGDYILSINNQDVSKNREFLIETVQTMANQTVPFTINRDGLEKEIMVTIGAKKIGTKEVGTLGLAFEMKEIAAKSFFSAIKQGITLTNDWIMRTIYGFVSIFKDRAVQNVGGPIVIISVLTQGATSSLKIFLLLLAIISINLAILNLIPLPILDGGQLLFYTIEAIIGRPLPLKVREYIHIGSWLLILGLILYLSVKDVARIASPYIESVTQFLGIGR